MYTETLQNFSEKLRGKFPLSTLCLSMVGSSSPRLRFLANSSTQKKPGRRPKTAAKRKKEEKKEKRKKNEKPKVVTCAHA